MSASQAMSSWMASVDSSQDQTDADIAKLRNDLAALHEYVLALEVRLTPRPIKMWRWLMCLDN